MMKKFYVSALFLTAAAFLITIFTGTFNQTAMVVFGFIGLGLIYAPALWTVIASMREAPLR